MWALLTRRLRSRTAVLEIDVQWFVNQADTNPVHTEVLEFPLMDRAVTDTMIEQRLRDRAAELDNAVIRFAAIDARLGQIAGQKVKLS